MSLRATQPTRTSRNSRVQNALLFRQPKKTRCISGSALSSGKSLLYSKTENLLHKRTRICKTVIVFAWIREVKIQSRKREAPLNIDYYIEPTWKFVIIANSASIIPKQRSGKNNEFITPIRSWVTELYHQPSRTPVSDWEKQRLWVYG